MKRLSRAIGAFFCLFLPAMGAAQESYTFDLAEIEKKPYHLGGYVEFKPLLFGLDRESAFYKLRFYRAPQGETMPEWNGRVQWEGSYEKGSYRVYAKMNTDLKGSPAGSSERTLFHEAYGSVKPSSSLKVEAGKKALRWGKGYAWSPVAFLDRPKDPDDPELGQEGYIVAAADFIKSFDGPLKTFSFTPVLLPVYEGVNDGFGNRGRLNIAGRLYFLLYDTDIDLLFLTGGSRTDRYGFDFSRNITANFAVHGEFAYIRNQQRSVLDAGGGSRILEGDVRSALVGIRYLTAFDLTAIAEYYHNGAGFAGDEMRNYYAFINRGYDLYRSTGNASVLTQAQTMAEGAYGRSSAMRDYLYLRLVQKEPFDILYWTPALTGMWNLADGSFSLTPEVLYTGVTNLELRFRTTFIVGGRNTEFGEKQNDYRIELRIGYYF